MKSLIIIGKGYSITKCTKEFVDSHDEVAIVNSPVYGEYEKFISNHADYLFTNRTGMIYSNEEIKKLGLKAMIFTGRPKQRFKKVSKLVKVIYPNPNLFQMILPIVGGLGPNSGVQALMYFINHGTYDTISLVGFDFHQVGLPPYYFDPKYAHSSLKYMWKGNWKNNIIGSGNLAGHHPEKECINLVTDTIKQNSSIKFNIITFNSKFNDIKINNLKLM